jgi:periplasmic protein CpxP/Spy
MKMRLTKMRRTGLAAALISALLLVAAIVGFAQGGPQDGPRRGGGPRGERGGPRGGGPIPFLRDLNLTDAQKAQVKQIVDGFEASTRELHEKLRALRGNEMDAFKDGAFDEAAVRSAAQARAAVEVELSVARARMMSQVYSVLTAEQKATIAERRQQFEQRRKEREDAERGAKSDTN